MVCYFEMYDLFYGAIFQSYVMKKAICKSKEKKTRDEMDMKVYEELNQFINN
jgi:hypothetical protein